MSHACATMGVLLAVATPVVGESGPNGPARLNYMNVVRYSPKSAVRLAQASDARALPTASAKYPMLSIRSPAMLILLSSIM